ncbi:hypothetical protein F5890DRAFT_1290327 [Lentinula detonsa]|uniref:Uncharacterized protein n=1 Tax=Lentinula detonsa TaxID=2804962 RepID=A0AA38PZF7_9AGAR|nr:hypothetical protein F5890DRAFT_1290327 [Lentinula detonsa]
MSTLFSEVLFSCCTLLLHGQHRSDQTPPTDPFPGYSSDSSSSSESSSSLSAPSYPYSLGLVSGMTLPTSNAAQYAHADIVDVTRVRSMPRGFANLLFPAGSSWYW